MHQHSPFLPRRSERRLARRVFLSALGLGMAVPVASHFARLAHAQPTPGPVRLLSFFVPHGLPAEHCEPYGQGDRFLANSKILSPLAPYGASVALVRGVGISPEWLGHPSTEWALTGTKEADSIDNVIADALDTKAYHLGAYANEPTWANGGLHPFAYLVKRGVWSVAIDNPADAADKLGLTSRASPAPANVDETKFRELALELTEAQLERMQGALHGLTSEQNKLDQHLHALRKLKAEVTQPSTGSAACGATPSLATALGLRGTDTKSNVYADYARIVDGHLEVIANAFVCGRARVVTLQNLFTNIDLHFDFSGGPGIAGGSERHGHHLLSHDADPQGRADFAQCQRWFYERLATKLLAVLGQPDPLEPSKTVLDNTLIYLFSETSDGVSHYSGSARVNGAQSCLPAILIGKAGGRITRNGVVDVGGAGHDRPHLDMLATLAAAMGVTLSSVGGKPASAIKELLS